MTPTYILTWSAFSVDSNEILFRVSQKGRKLSQKTDFKDKEECFIIYFHCDKTYDLINNRHNSWLRIDGEFPKVQAGQIVSLKYAGSIVKAIVVDIGEDYDRLFRKLEELENRLECLEDQGRSFRVEDSFVQEVRSGPKKQARLYSWKHE